MSRGRARAALVAVALSGCYRTTTPESEPIVFRGAGRGWAKKPRIEQPRLTAAGATVRVSTDPTSPAGCSFVAYVTGQAGSPGKRPSSVDGVADPGRFEASLPREAATNAARNAAAAGGANLITIEAYAAFEFAWPSVQQTNIAIHGRAFRCPAPAR